MRYTYSPFANNEPHRRGGIVARSACLQFFALYSARNFLRATHLWNPHRYPTRHNYYIVVAVVGWKTRLCHNPQFAICGMLWVCGIASCRILAFEVRATPYPKRKSPSNSLGPLVSGDLFYAFFTTLGGIVCTRACNTPASSTLSQCPKHRHRIGAESWQPAPCTHGATPRGPRLAWWFSAPRRRGLLLSA